MVYCKLLQPIVIRTSYFFSVVVLLLLHFGTAYSQDKQRYSLKRVVIDPGHGGRDPGASGAKSREKDIVLDISLKLGKMITEKFPDVEVIYTRKTDIKIELDKRADIANKAHADLFISIHANAVGGVCPSGAMTFVMGNDKSTENMEIAKRENSVILLEEDYSTKYAGFDPADPESYIVFELMQNNYLHQSINFAGEVQSNLKAAKRVDRGVRQANFLVLWLTTMPSVLVEVGFICHPEEEKYISSAAGKEKIASSIFQAFSNYKTKVEDRSLFSSAELSSDAKNEQASKKVEYCIQIATSSKPIDTNPNNFKQHRDVERFKHADNLYKYVVGRSFDYETVQEKLKKIRADYGDAFVVCIVDGKIVPLTEGRKIITE